MPNARAIGVIKLMWWSAYRFAALAPLGRAIHIWRDNLAPLGLLSLARERSGRHSSAGRIAALARLRSAIHLWWDSLSSLVLRLSQIPEGGDCPTCGELHVDNERAQRCGSSDHAAAAEGVEDDTLQGSFGVNGHVAQAVTGAEG